MMSDKDWRMVRTLRLHRIAEGMCLGSAFTFAVMGCVETSVAAFLMLAVGVVASREANRIESALRGEDDG